MKTLKRILTLIALAIVITSCGSIHIGYPYQSTIDKNKTYCETNYPKPPYGLPDSTIKYHNTEWTYVTVTYIYNDHNDKNIVIEYLDSPTGWIGKTYINRLK